MEVLITGASWKPRGSLVEALIGGHAICSYSQSVTFNSQPDVSTVTLRPYQERCVRACLDALESGTSRCGVSLPTGSGKTVIFLHLLSNIQPGALQGNRTRSIVLVNNVELARQTAEQARRFFPEWTVEIEQGKEHASGTAQLTVATWQSLSQPDRLAKYDPSQVKAIIVDEAHHGAADSYRNILSQFHSDILPANPSRYMLRAPQLPPVPVIGFSATFSRSDDLELSSIFLRLVYSRGLVEMIEAGWLCNVKLTSVKTPLWLKDVAVDRMSRDFSPGGLARVMNTPAMNSLVVKAWREKAVGRKSTIIFCTNLEHLRTLTRTFVSFGIDARHIDSTTPAGARDALLDGFRKGAFPVLLNCEVLTEGVDIPNIDCVILARPTKSENLLTQMLGRGLRLSPGTGKLDCRIIDFCDAASNMSDWVSVQSLFDPTLRTGPQAKPDRLVDRIRIQSDRKRTDEETEPPLIPAPPAPAKYIDDEDPLRLISSEFSGARHLRSITRNSWVKCIAGTYVLELMGEGFIRVDDVAGASLHQRWHAIFFHTSNTSSPRRCPIARAASLHDAICASDLYAKRKGSQCHRTSSWRSKPISEMQMQKIKSLWPHTEPILLAHPQGDYQIPATDILLRCTRGDAGDILSRVIRGRWR